MVNEEPGQPNISSITEKTAKCGNLFAISGSHFFSGQVHSLMSLEELSELVKDSVESLKEQAEQRLDELSVLLKETTSTLNSWDVETDETVTLIHKTRDEHVCFPFYRKHQALNVYKRLGPAI